MLSPPRRVFHPDSLFLQQQVGDCRGQESWPTGSDQAHGATPHVLEGEYGRRYV